MLTKSFIVMAAVVTIINADSCAPVPKHYTELRCKEIKANPSDSCPSQ